MLAFFLLFNPMSIKKIGLICSGGDAPGMNAAIRAVVRTAIGNKLEVTGFLGGYQGILSEKSKALDLRNMANIIQRGGTILKTGRCSEFMKPEGRAKASVILRKASIDALVVIGGDGSFQGAHLLFQETGFPCVGIPGTIDNDIPGTDHSIGFDTAVNTALEAIDRVRDTAASHDRLFIVEVMGRDSGLIAAHVGLAGGAEEIFAPEYPIGLDTVVAHIQNGINSGKSSSILVTAEGQKPGRAYDLAEQLRKRCNLEARVCILGHQQRGGSPTAFDRILATRMGAHAVHCLLKDKLNVMVADQNGKMTETPFQEISGKRKSTPKEFLELTRNLAI